MCESTNWFLKKVSWRNFFSEIEVFRKDKGHICYIRCQTVKRGKNKKWLKRSSENFRRWNGNFFLKRSFKNCSVPPNSAPSLRLRLRPSLGRSKCPTTPLFSMLCLFLEFPVSVFHHPVHELLSIGLSFPLFFSILPSIISLAVHCSLQVYTQLFRCIL